MKYLELELSRGGRLTGLLRTPAAAVPCRPAVIVIPGGGYTHVGTREGEPVAMQFSAAGYHTFVLESYGVEENARDLTPLRQLSEAIGLLRSHADEWGILPEKIAVCGFSAGGHLALSSAVLPLPDGPQHRPDAVLLGYPVVTAGPHAHRGSFRALSGSDDLAAHAAFGLEDRITPDTPPVFLWHTMTDETVPVENSLLLLSALRRAGVPCEAHFFPDGPHGMSLATPEVGHDRPHAHRWVELALEWLAQTFSFSV